MLLDNIENIGKIIAFEIGGHIVLLNSIEFIAEYTLNIYFYAEYISLYNIAEYIMLNSVEYTILVILPDFYCFYIKSFNVVIENCIDTLMKHS